MTRKRRESAGTCLIQPQRPKPIPGISKRGSPSPWTSYSMLESSVILTVGMQRSLPRLLVLPWDLLTADCDDSAPGIVDA